VVGGVRWGHCAPSAYSARPKKGWPGSGGHGWVRRPREKAAGERNGEKRAVRPVLHECHPRERERKAEADQPRPRAVPALAPGRDTDPDQEQWQTEELDRAGYAVHARREAVGERVGSCAHGEDPAEESRPGARESQRAHSRRRYTIGVTRPNERYTLPGAASVDQSCRPGSDAIHAGSPPSGNPDGRGARQDDARRHARDHHTPVVPPSRGRRESAASHVTFPNAGAGKDDFSCALSRC
jgi:hypothetical protein